MKREEDEKLWDLLGHSAEPKVSPFFARHVLRKIRQAQGERVARPWCNLRWLVPAAGVAVAMFAAVSLRFQLPGRPQPELRGDAVVLSEAPETAEMPGAE